MLTYCLTWQAIAGCVTGLQRHGLLGASWSQHGKKTSVPVPGITFRLGFGLLSPFKQFRFCLEHISYTHTETLVPSVTTSSGCAIDGMPLYVVVGTAIAKMLIVLAECLSLVVIAEGVETVAQLDFLLQLGCIAFQGYMFSRPLPVAEFEALATGWLSVPLAAH